MFFSNLVMYFIILTTAATLHAHGIDRHRDGAARPPRRCGRSPATAPTALHARADRHRDARRARARRVRRLRRCEAMAWRGTLDDRPRLAPKFYAVIAVAMLLGLALDFAGLDAVKMLFWSAVLNGVLAPPLIVLVVLLTSDPTVMGERVSSRTLRWLGWATAVVMTVAAVGMFATL